jgi:hypothetical protein
MKKKNYFTGSVFQFYVPEIKKYCYCKYFDFKHISKFHGLLAQAFDCFMDEEIEKLDQLNDCDYLFGARSMFRWPNLRTESNWKYLGIISGKHDEEVPDFKGIQTFHKEEIKESEIGPWYAIRNLTERGPDCDYKDVQHLEKKTITVASLNFSWRTGMEYCRINGLKVEDYYNLNDEAIRTTYLQMINTPIYKTIPKNIRGKAQCYK